MKILVIRFSSIGDIVLTSPVVRCLKKQLPDAEIHFLTKYSYKEIIEHNPYIDVKHFLKDDFSGIVRDLKKEKFDFVVDLHNNLRTLKIKIVLITNENTAIKTDLPPGIYLCRLSSNPAVVQKLIILHTN